MIGHGADSSDHALLEHVFDALHDLRGSGTNLPCNNVPWARHEWQTRLSRKNDGMVEFVEFFRVSHRKSPCGQFEIHEVLAQLRELEDQISAVAFD